MLRLTDNLMDLLVAYLNYFRMIPVWISADYFGKMKGTCFYWHLEIVFNWWVPFRAINGAVLL